MREVIPGNRSDGAGEGPIKGGTSKLVTWQAERACSYWHLLENWAEWTSEFEGWRLGHLYLCIQVNTCLLYTCPLLVEGCP